jgi:hypothetical protein
MAYLDNYLTARKERLLKGKPKKPSQLIKGQRRQAVINEVMDKLGDWRLSPFENQGALHAGLRSALCISGNTWLSSEIEAASIVGESLRMIGAEYPTWDQGQPEHTVPDDQCKKCGGPMPEEAREGLRRYRFCSNECARAAWVRVSQSSAWKNSSIAWSAYRMILETRTTPRKCKTCLQEFRVLRENSDAQYCSRACFGAHRVRLADIICPSCNKTFHPRRHDKKFCSKSCADAGNSLRSYPRTCFQCEEAFDASNPHAQFCSDKCGQKHRYWKKKAPARVIPFVPMHMLTAEVFDGWFRRAA